MYAYLDRGWIVLGSVTVRGGCGRSEVQQCVLVCLYERNRLEDVCVAPVVRGTEQGKPR